MLEEKEPLYLVGVEVKSLASVEIGTRFAQKVKTWG